MGVRSAGFSKDMAERVARGKLRQSSLKVYDSRWKGFCMWCSARRLSPWHATVQQIVEFLHDIFIKGDLKVRTRYKSAIATTFKARVVYPTFADLLVVSTQTDW